MTSAWQPTLPGMAADRHRYAWTRIRNLTDALNCYERSFGFWDHEAEVCDCAGCTQYRQDRAEHAQLTREVNARVARHRNPERGPRATPRPRVVSSRTSAGHAQQDRQQDYNGIGESGRREGWDYWE